MAQSMAYANSAGLGDANTRIEPARLSYEQPGAGQGELPIGAAVVEPQPAAFDREVETSLIRGAGAAMQERPVDQFDMDAGVLHRLDGDGDLHQFARGGFWGSTNLVMPPQFWPFGPISAPFRRYAMKPTLAK